MLGRLCALCFLCVSSAALAQQAVSVSGELPGGTIDVREAEAPGADTYGLDSTRFPHASYAGSSPAQLQHLMTAISPQIGPGVLREILSALLVMPVYPDSASAVPKGWLLLRIDKLIHMAAYEDAFRLLSSLPKEMRNETLARRYVDLALTIGDTQAACVEVSERLASDQTAIDAYWSLRRAFCHRIADEHDEAEFVLGFFSEQYPGQYPLTLATLTGWGEKKGTLPPFTTAEGDATPLLIALLKKHAQTSQAPARLKPGFIAAPAATTLAPGLAVILSEQEALALPLRIALLEHAVMRGAGQPETLRHLYEQAAEESELSGESRQRALLIADIMHTQTPDNRIAAVATALTRFKRDMTPATARGLVGAELEAFTDALPTHMPPAPMVLDMATFHMERGDSRRFEQVLRFLERQDADDPSYTVALAAIRQALALDRMLHGEGGANPAMPPIEQVTETSALWILHRQVSVEEALGHQVPPASKGLSMSAPLAQSASPAPQALLALQEAEDRKLQGELLLHAVSLLEEGRLPYVSDNVVSRLIAALQNAGLHTYAARLAQAAILNPPIEPFRRGAVP